MHTINGVKQGIVSVSNDEFLRSTEWRGSEVRESVWAVWCSGSSEKGREERSGCREPRGEERGRGGSLSSGSRTPKNHSPRGYGALDPSLLLNPPPYTAALGPLAYTPPPSCRK